MTYKPIPLTATGEVITRDSPALGLLGELIKEIKRLNFHLSLMTGAPVSVDEVEE